MDFLIMIVATVIFSGMLAAKSEGEGRKKRTQNVGPTSAEWAETLNRPAVGHNREKKTPLSAAELRRTFEGGSASDETNVWGKKFRRHGLRDAAAEQAREHAAERRHSEKRWAEARRQQADALRVHAAGVDSCEGRLESLKVLYDAGILDRDEYLQRVERVKSRHTQV